jgi:hypothetical protein
VKSFPVYPDEHPGVRQDLVGELKVAHVCEARVGHVAKLVLVTDLASSQTVVRACELVELVTNESWENFEMCDA